MILSQNYRRALGAVGSAGLSNLDALAKAIWRNHVAGELSEPEAAGLIAALEGRRGHAWIPCRITWPRRSCRQTRTAALAGLVGNAIRVGVAYR